MIFTKKKLNNWYIMKEHMKTILILLFSFLSYSYSSAQASFSGLKIDVTTENDSIFLKVVYKNEKKRIVETPKLLLRLMNDDVMLLDGKLLGVDNKTEGGVMVYGVIVAANEYVSEAKFYISKEQMIQIGKGVKKLRLNTSPKYLEKEWEKDKIGKKLYDKYLKSSSNSFQDNF